MLKILENFSSNSNTFNKALMKRLKIVKTEALNDNAQFEYTEMTCKSQIS